MKNCKKSHNFFKNYFENIPTYFLKFSSDLFSKIFSRIQKILPKTQLILQD